MIPNNASAEISAAVAVLSEADPVIARLASLHGLPILEKRSLVDFTVEGWEDPAYSRADLLFSELVEVVIHQQLAGKAAVAITSRVRQAFDGQITAERVQGCSPEVLRTAGLSGAKIAAIAGLANAVVQGELSLESLVDLGDDAVTWELSKLRGFGPWSAQMFLMFSLGRIDVWPVGDLGVRKGYRASYGLEEIPSPRELLQLGERFRPYRSLVAWYLWRSLSS